MGNNHEKRLGDIEEGIGTLKTTNKSEHDSIKVRLNALYWVFGILIVGNIFATIFTR